MLRGGEVAACQVSRFGERRYHWSLLCKSLASFHWRLFFFFSPSLSFFYLIPSSSALIPALPPPLSPAPGLDGAPPDRVWQLRPQSFFFCCLSLTFLAFRRHLHGFALLLPPLARPFLSFWPKDRHGSPHIASRNCIVKRGEEEERYDDNVALLSNTIVCLSI